MRLQRNILSSIFALFFLIITGYACYNIGYLTIKEADNVTTTIGLIVVCLLIFTVGFHFIKDGGHLDFFQGNNHLYTIIELVVLGLFLVITFIQCSHDAVSTIIMLALMYTAGRISAGRIGGIATTIFGWFFITTSYINILNFDTNIQICSLLACYIIYHLTTKNLLHVKDDKLYIMVSYIIMSIIFAIGIALSPLNLFLFLFCFVSLCFSSGMDTDDRNNPFASGKKCGLYFLGITIGAFFILNLITGLASGTELTGTTILNRFSETFSTKVDATLFQTASGKTDTNILGNVLAKYNGLISMLYHAFSSGIWPFLVLFFATVTGYFTIKKDRSYIAPLIASYLLIFFMYIFFGEKGSAFIYLDCIVPVFAGYGFSNLIATETAVWGNNEVDTDVEFVLDVSEEDELVKKRNDPETYGIKISTGKPSDEENISNESEKKEEQSSSNPFADPFMSDDEEKEIMLRPLASSEKEEKEFKTIPADTVETMINGATLSDSTLSVTAENSEFNAFSEPYVGGYGEAMLGVPEEVDEQLDETGAEAEIKLGDTDSQLDTADENSITENVVDKIREEDLSSEKPAVKETAQIVEETPVTPVVTAFDLNEIKEMIAKVQEEVSSVIDAPKSREAEIKETEANEADNKIAVAEEPVVEEQTVEPEAISEQPEVSVEENSEPVLEEAALETEPESIEEPVQSKPIVEPVVIEEPIVEPEAMTIEEPEAMLEQPEVADEVSVEENEILEEEPELELRLPEEETAEPILEVQPEFVSAPEINVEPETVIEPEPVVEPEPVIEPEVIAEPEPVVEPEPVIEPEVIAEPEPVVEPEPVIEPEVIAEPEPVVESESVIEPEVIAEPEPVVEPEPVIEPEVIAEPEPIVESESVIEPEVIAEPEPVVEQEPVIEPTSQTEEHSIPKIKRDYVAEQEPATEEEVTEPVENKPLRGQDILLGETKDASAFPEWSLDDLFVEEEVTPDDTNVPSDEELVSMMESEETIEIKSIPDEELIPDAVEEPSFDDLVTTVQQEKEEEEQELAKIHEEIKIKMQRVQNDEEELEDIKPHNDLSQLLDRLNVSDTMQQKMETAQGSADMSGMNSESDFFANRPDFEEAIEEETEEVTFAVDPNFVEADLAPEPATKIKREPISARFARQNQKPVESFEISSEPVFLLEDDVKDTKPENVLAVEEVEKLENELAVEEIEKPENELAVEEIEKAENDLNLEEEPEEDDNILHFKKDEKDADTTSVEVTEPEETLFRNISVSSSDPIIQSAPITAEEITEPKNPADVSPTTQLPDYEAIDNIDEFLTETTKTAASLEDSDGLLIDDDAVVIEDTATEEKPADDFGFEFDIDDLTNGVVRTPVEESNSSEEDYDDEFAISIDDLTK